MGLATSERSAGASVAQRARDAAVAAATETLLNCYLREGGTWRLEPAAAMPAVARDGESHVAVLPLPGLGVELLAGVRYLSPTHRHRFRTPVMIADGGSAPFDVTLDTLAGMLVSELGGSHDRNVVLRRMRASVHAVAAFLEARDRDVDALYGDGPLSFIASEQALLLGHMLHPTPKSRTEMTPEQLLAFAPETAASFQLHWLAIDPHLVTHDSATGTPATELAAQLLRADPDVDQAALDARLAELGPRVLVPAHPWELAHLRSSDPVVAALLDHGTIVDLGPMGGRVAPTTSVRTVYNATWPYQLKFSLHVRVTNSLRVTLPKELLRAVEAARLLRTEVGERADQIAPDFVMLQDPAYIAVRHGGQIIDGLSVILRDNRWRTDAQGDVSAVTTLCQDHPYGGRSRLGAILAAIARRTGRGEDDVAREWFARYCEAVIVPLVRLFCELGLCMEPHQQNVVIELDDGWPARAVYRDSQGYFHREAAHEDIAPLVADSTSVFGEALADERLVYYPFLNNALGVINAIGVAGCGAERVLLADLRALLERERARGARYPATLLDRLLDDATWPCKANLRTRMHDMDELVGDIATQSVYVTIPNPLHGLRDLALRPIDYDADLALVHGWMQEPHVAPWWELEGPSERVRAYLAASAAAAHIDVWIATDGGRPVAYVETYRVADDPIAQYYEAQPGDHGFHLLVGPPELLGTGLARDLVRTVVSDLLGEPAATRVVCEPDVRNARMLGFCRAVGGEELATLEMPGRTARLFGWTRERPAAAA